MIHQKKKYQWDDNWNMPPATQTINAQQLAGRLLEAQVCHPNARFIEFSRGNNDINKVRRFLRENGGFDWVLGDHEGLGMMPLWNDKLPGFWYMAQAIIFELLHPDHALAYDSHRAFVDAQKLHILFRDLVADSAD